MIKIAFHHTQATNGGFGVLGKGIAQALLTSPNFKVVYLNGEILHDESPDIILLYGMPDLYGDVGLKLRAMWRRWIPIAFYHVWESSKMPKDFVKVYKKVDLLLTATEFTRLCDNKQGLYPKVWHHAVDGRFKYKERLDDGVFTFVHHNAYEYRKGWELVLQAFTEEFNIDEPVKLIMKARERKHSVWLLPKQRPLTIEQLKDRKTYYQSLRLNHPLIEEIIGHVTDDEMVSINDRADCFVFPAKGEGWGLPPFEAMAQGIVPIVPNVGAFTEWFDKKNMIDIKPVRFINSEPRYPGYMFSFTVKALRKQLRYAFEHQDVLKIMGKHGSDRIHDLYNWDKVTNELHTLIYNFLTSKRGEVYKHRYYRTTKWQQKIKS